MKCNRCGYCCTLRVKLSFSELLRIMFSGNRKKDFVDKDNLGRNCIKLVDGDCYFLERYGKTSSCKIYSKRPKMCREYPGENVDCDKIKKDNVDYLLKSLRR